MACNVFGAPITNETLRGMREYRTKIGTQEDRAKVAMEMKNADGKDVNARTFAVNMRDRFGDSVATMCMIYNATGDPIRLYKFYNWNGCICESPLPILILNGQWGVFVHGKYWNKSNASVGALVYSAHNNQAQERHWLVSWSNKFADDLVNKVYAEIRGNTHYNAPEIWDLVYPWLDKGDVVSQPNEDGGMMMLSIGQNRISVMEAILTLPEASN